jgi:hypothetical protein
MSVSSSFGNGQDMDSQRITELGQLLGNALHTAARGRRLKRTERTKLAQYLTGNDLSGYPSRFSEEAKIARAQTMLLGRDLRRAFDRISNSGDLTKSERHELRAWLSGISQSRVRYRLRSGLWIVCAALLAFLAPFFLRPEFRYLNGNPVWIPFIVAVTVLLAALIKDVMMEKNIDITLRHMKWTIEQMTDNLEDFLDENLEPRIRVLNGREGVRRAASKLFEEILTEPGEHPIVMFTGAASLATVKRDEPEDLDESKQSSVEEYNTRLLQLQGASVQVRRYVVLIKSPDFSSRRVKTLEEYSAWLGKQLDLLKENSGYLLVDCYRSQPWGGARSSIITKNGFLDMIGDGESAFLIKGERIAEVLYTKSRKLLDGANQRMYRGGHSDDLCELRDLKAQLDQFLSRNGGGS